MLKFWKKKPVPKPIYHAPAEPQPVPPPPPCVDPEKLENFALSLEGMADELIREDQNVKGALTHLQLAEFYRARAARARRQDNA